jgi:AcrR family transcriptional regulator
MGDRLEPRKKPSQQRSKALVEAVLDAAVRVLAEQGPSKFTTKRVADRAGISVGSLYQYFPNKESILATIQQEEESETLRKIDAVLSDANSTPRQRLETAIRIFFETEAAEAHRRGILHASLQIYAPEQSKSARAVATARLERFLAENELVEPARAAFAADLAVTTLSCLAEDVTSRYGDDWDEWAKAAYEMIATQFDPVRPRGKPREQRGT